MELRTKSFLPLSAYKVIEDKYYYIAYLKGGKIAHIPKKITLDKDLIWLIGVWIGDNFGARGGSKPTTKRGLKTSGRFGIINNDLDIVKKAIGVMKKIKLKNLRIDVQLPRDMKTSIDSIQKMLYHKDLIIRLQKASEWRREIGFAVYVNNTSLLRTFEHFFKNLRRYKFDVTPLIAGIIDSEGNIDKANKMIQITNKENYVQQIIECSLNKIGVKYVKRTDKRERICTLIKDKDSLYELFKELELGSKRKKLFFSEMQEGNFTRPCDFEYMKRFSKELKKGVSVNELSTKHHIPKPTIKMVLRNLWSGGFLERFKDGHGYIYSFASAELSSKPSAKRDN